MSTGLRTGLNNKLYRNAGSHGSPSWTEISTAQDVGLPFDKDMAEVKARLSTWNQFLPALKSGPLDFGMLGDTSVATYDVLRDAYINDTIIDFAIADQSIVASGAEYFRADYYVKQFPLDQKLEEANAIKVSAVMAYSGNAPAFVNVS